MLTTLTLRDFVIVDQLTIDFGPGFTVFSGETGAGKSILIEALKLALGERSEARFIRGYGSAQAAARAEIIAEFTASVEVQTWLAAQDLATDDQLIIRRVIDDSARSKAWINGTPVTLTQLREIGAQLVDIHGQHAHQALLRNDAQRRMLDEHAGLNATVQAVEQAYRAWQKINLEIERQQNHAQHAQREREHLEWRHSELARLAPQPGEWQQIQQEHERLAHAAHLIDGAQHALNLLSENEESLQNQINAITTRLGHLAQSDGQLTTIVETLEPAAIQIQEAVYGLNHYLSRIELDPQRLAALETRIDALHSTARKLRVAPGDLAQELDSVSQQLAQLQASSDLAALHAQQQEAQASYQKIAKKLSSARHQAAQQLAAAITQGMQSLSMPGGRFAINLASNPPAAHGLEQVEFLVAAHPGAIPQALNKVASGGELARISLAISVIASGASSVATLIFDEVDSGIGGAVAEVVGKLLRELGKIRQVLCVTHLPQVAALGQVHFSVNKRTVKDQTLSQIKALTHESRIDEIARMLGGIDITTTTRQHAHELLTKF